MYQVNNWLGSGVFIINFELCSLFSISKATQHIDIIKS